MPKFKSRLYPTEISEALLWTGHNKDEIEKFVGAPCLVDADRRILAGTDNPFWAWPGEWIIHWYGGDWGKVSASSFSDRFDAVEGDQ